MLAGTAGILTQSSNWKPATMYNMDDIIFIIN